MLAGVNGAELRRAMRAVIDFALPPSPLEDAGRRAPAVQSSGLSAERWSKIRFIEEPCCEACGVPFEFDQGEGAHCLACQARRPAFARLRAACLYDEHSRDLILKLKHADRTDLSGLFALWIARAARRLIAEADFIAPIPLHPRRLFARRYNQAAEIARPLARLSAARFMPDGLVRRRATQSQGGKSAASRRRNVAGVFAVAPPWRARIAGRRILLIDDVLTTGATAEGCARALIAAGARAVDVAVIARTPLKAARSLS